MSAGTRPPEITSYTQANNMLPSSDAQNIKYVIIHCNTHFSAELS